MNPLSLDLCDIMERSRTVIENYSPACTREFLDELDALGVVLLLNIGVVGELLVSRWALVKEEPIDVERHRVFFTPQILDFEIVGFPSPVPAALSSLKVCVDITPWLRAVGRRDKVDQLGLDEGGLFGGNRHGEWLDDTDTEYSVKEYL